MKQQAFETHEQYIARLESKVERLKAKLERVSIWLESATVASGDADELSAILADDEKCDDRHGGQ